MFYKSGIDITNDKQMFNFLKDHFTYSTLNSWNKLKSIANDVKLYRLNLSGDWATALGLLENGEYDTISIMLQDWQVAHPGYSIGFNGRSGGYLVLYNKNDNDNVLPVEISECEDYDEYKRYCREYYGSVKANRSDLVFYTKLVQDFDKLCDELRNFCDQLSQLKLNVETMETVVDEFNDRYYDDCEYLSFNTLVSDSEGRVDCSEIFQLNSLRQAFVNIANRACTSTGLELKITKDDVVYFD